MGLSLGLTLHINSASQANTIAQDNGNHTTFDVEKSATGGGGEATQASAR